MNLIELRHQIEAEIASYVYKVPEGAVGNPMTSEWVAEQLAEFKSALVAPILRKIRIADSVSKKLGEKGSEYHECVLVADDRNGYQLYYDPQHKDCLLAFSDQTPPTAFLRGDAVGCFMAR
ncbi:MAG: hypothetical protein KDF59_05010 [Nitrosomonas sp.]|nr:hypothetical protein [Nitrosomonas sp.]